ncbi:HMG-box [Trametes sanguinea]|nr:HMG-box [Trametes sanguinea]
MSRYPPNTHYSPPAIAGLPAQDTAGSSSSCSSPAAARADHHHVRHDRDSSLSDSETSTSLNAYPENAKDDASAAGAQDDPYLALTSQTLNADGTPKRPMNAFMIFARKRRPQISAANQMMRTGDVSKILSKEWNSMDMADKKFYLDQAKKLKDNFNSKYPDYVYRRRPNNSRKKRKPDMAHDDGAGGDAHLGDPDDPAYDDTSPIDPDDALMVPSPQEGSPAEASSRSASGSSAHSAAAPLGFWDDRFGGR